MTTFGARLRSSRKQAKLTQKDVAKRIGMSQSLLSELENDEYPTSVFTIQLAHLYKVSARWLAEGKGSREISAAEMLDDERVSRLWMSYQALDEASRAIVDYLVWPPGDQRPEWMSEGAAAAIDSAKLLVAEQLKERDAAQLGLDVKK